MNKRKFLKFLSCIPFLGALGSEKAKAETQQEIIEKIFKDVQKLRLDEYWHSESPAGKMYFGYRTDGYFLYKALDKNKQVVEISIQKLS